MHRLEGSRSAPKTCVKARSAARAHCQLTLTLAGESLPSPNLSHLSLFFSIQLSPCDVLLLRSLCGLSSKSIVAARSHYGVQGHTDVPFYIDNPSAIHSLCSSRYCRQLQRISPRRWQVSPMCVASLGMSSRSDVSDSSNAGCLCVNRFCLVFWAVRLLLLPLVKCMCICILWLYPDHSPTGCTCHTCRLWCSSITGCHVASRPV